jgi:hypothetical protein
MFFEPDSAERTEDIIQKGYVSSEEVTKYDQILETFLRDNVRSVQVPTAKEIATRQNQEGLLTPEIRSFQRRLPATGQVQLLIGPVGSGKSLFCQRYYNFLRPADLIESTFWSFLNFNDAPENLESVENWVCKTFLESFEKEYPGFDLFSETNLRRIFAPDVNRLRKIYGRVVEADPAAFELRLANELATLTADVQRFAKSLCRFIMGDQRKAVVTVFDNVDRRDREQQVKIFQVAQWFRSETRSFCLVSLRDETYEQFKRQPPLDAFINSIHFTITPPRFIDVIRKRLELCIGYAAEETPDKLAYTLPDGIKITYPATKLGEFLKTLYLDIFRSGRRVSWLLEALSGRNVRQSLGMFSRILMSGHLDERQITGTILGTESFTIRDSTIVNVLMKTDYLYFDNEHGFITNIFFCNPDWERHSNLLVPELLEFLVSRRKRSSALGPQGYFAVSDVLAHVNRIGFPASDALSALEFLLGRGLVTADHMGRTTLSQDDFVRAHASGFVHARLLPENMHYMSGVIPSTFITDRGVAERLGRLASINAGFTDIQFRRKQEIVYIFLEYLRKEYDRHCHESPLYANQAVGSRGILRMVQNCLDGLGFRLGERSDQTLL